MDQQVLPLLAELLRKPLVSIEILPGNFEQWAPQATEDFPFVLTDNHLGIPQKLLYKLYIAAVALYKNADYLAALTFTSVILLVNPSHQTALNTRKRLVESGRLQPEEELKLIALFIGGSKEFAKQSIIWHYRRWIFRHCYQHIGGAGAGSETESPGWGTSEEASSFPIIPLDTLEKECQLIRRACDLYPRNYHAWVHYHWVLDTVKAVVLRNQVLADPNCEDHLCFLRREVLQLQEWIDRHVSDYSAVHLLCSLTILDRAGAFQLAKSGRGKLVDELREHARSLVLSYPSHETLWLYLRNILYFSSIDATRDALDWLRQKDMPVVAIEKYIADLI